MIAFMQNSLNISSCKNSLKVSRRLFHSCRLKNASLISLREELFTITTVNDIELRRQPMSTTVLNTGSKPSVYRGAQKRNTYRHFDSISFSENTRVFSGSAAASAAKEFCMKTPTGNIAGKVWNADAPVAVLCLHGHLDNAGTFDSLVPLLPDHLCCVAIDFPGHGWSSHYPPGTSNTLLHYIIPVVRVIRHFGWKQALLLGHSMGGGIGMLCAGTKPSLIHSLLSIDLVKPVHHDADTQPMLSEKFLDNLWLAEHKQLYTERPSYSYDELLQRVQETHHGDLDKTGVEILMRRGAQQLQDGRYSFTYSLNELFPRIQAISCAQVMAFAARLRCRMMVLKAADAQLYEDQKYADAAIETYRKSSAEFEYQVVPGGHHVHLSTPETVVPYVARFFSLDAVPDNNRSDSGGNLVSEGLLKL